MTDRHRAMLALHGGTVVLIALILGLLAVTDAPVDNARNWRSAHQTVLLFGLWSLATAGAATALRLEAREARGLVWALAVGGYSMTLTLVVRASTGVSGFELGGSPANLVAFVSNAVVMLSSVLAGLLTVSGAWNALRADPASSRHDTTASSP